MLFSELLDAELPEYLRAIIDDLLEMKRKMPEMGLAPKIKELDDFIDSELIAIKKAADEEDAVKNDWKILDEFFYKLVW